ncbi:MAG: hypothetical protein ACXQTM_06270 [Methanosarcinales archaeon]
MSIILEEIHNRCRNERDGFKTIRAHSNKMEEVETISSELITTFTDDGGKKIRLIGVQASNPKQMNFKQMRLVNHL